MTRMLHFLRLILGFDPFALAGVPNGFELLYLLTAIVSLPIFIPLGIWLGNRGSAIRTRVVMVGVVVICVLALTIVNETRFVEFVGQGQELRSDDERKNLTVALPLIANDTFADYAPGGRYYPRTRGIELREKAFLLQPAATYVTILLHLTLVLSALGGIIATLSSASVLITRLVRDRKL